MAGRQGVLFGGGGGSVGFLRRPVLREAPSSHPGSADEVAASLRTPVERRWEGQEPPDLAGGSVSSTGRPSLVEPAWDRCVPLKSVAGRGAPAEWE